VNCHEVSWISIVEDGSSFFLLCAADGYLLGSDPISMVDTLSANSPSSSIFIPVTPHSSLLQDVYQHAGRMNGSVRRNAERLDQTISKADRVDGRKED